MSQENKLLSPDNQPTSKDSKNKAKPKAKVNTIFVNGCEIKETVVIDTDEKREVDITSCNNRFKCIAQYNKDRDSYQGLVIYNGRKISLSFFRMRKVVWENIYLFIAIKNGFAGKNSKQVKVGD